MHNTTDVPGEQRVNIKHLGVHQEDYRSLETSVRVLSDIQAASVSIDGGVLRYTIIVGQLADKKRERLIEKTNAKVLQICQHKAEVPGPGSSRRKPRTKRYVNRTNLFAGTRR